MGKAPTTDAIVDRALTAKKAADSAARKASKISADQTINRSTRTRHALAAKAAGLDQVRGILAGKA